jgi:hypothetical protein
VARYKLLPNKLSNSHLSALNFWLATGNRLSEIGYQPANILCFGGRDQGPLPQMPLSFLSFARKEVALEAFVPFDLSAARDSESFGCGSIGFDFGHLVSPIVLIVELTITWG